MRYWYSQVENINSILYQQLAARPISNLFFRWYGENRTLASKFIDVVTDHDMPSSISTAKAPQDWFNDA
jgi:hypothetical protein